MTRVISPSCRTE